MDATLARVSSGLVSAVNIPASVCKAGGAQCHLLSQGRGKAMKAEDPVIIFRPFP